MILGVEATDFLSWENLKFDIDSGVTLINGFNHDDNTPEGSGKSAIPNAICWGLFGKLPKDAKVDDVIREGQKSCSVRIFLANGYEVIRTRKPNDLFIYDPSRDTKIKGKDAKETQALLEELLGLNFDTFVQSVYFAQNFPKKFVTSPEDEKAKILSDILNLKIFDKARSETNQLLRSESVNLLTLQKDLEAITDKIDGFQNHLGDIEHLKTVFEENKKTNVKNIQSEIKEIDDQIKTFEVKLKKLRAEDNSLTIKEMDADIEKLDAKKLEIASKVNSIEETKKLQHFLQAEISKRKHAVERIDEELGKYIEPEEDSRCPTCGNFLKDGEHEFIEKHIKQLRDDKKEIRKQLKEHEKDLKELSVIDTKKLRLELDKVIKVIKRIKENKRELEQVANKASLLDHKVEQFKKEKARMKHNLERELQKTTEPLDKKIKVIQKELKDAEGIRKEIYRLFKASEEYHGQLEVLKSGFKELKSYVFQNILEELTRKSNYFLQQLFEVPVKIKFKNTNDSGGLSKILTTVEIEGSERPLGLYSGGQFRRIQLAVDLALSDIISSRSDKAFDLRIFDEYMKDLSEHSMEKALNLIQKLKGSTIMIEHNTVFKSIIDNTFNIELINGVSREV